MRPDTSLTEADVAKVFNALADEHASRIEASEGQRTFLRIQRALSVPGREPRLSARRVATLTFAPALGAAALTLALTSWLSPDPLSFEVSGATERDGFVRTGSTPAVLSFSDESRVVARANTALNMSLVGDHGALARIQEGELSVKVEHAEETDWRFLAGPYEVRVVGTEFDIDWDSELEQLSVEMHEGRVRVIGPDKVETILSAGDKRTFGQPPRVVAAAPREPLASADSVAQQSEAPTGVVEPVREALKPAVHRPQPSWAKLVGKGLFDDVVKDAERVGIATALATKSSQDLQALAQAAHYTGRGALALETWSKVRQRFATQRSGQEAAFFMGRIHDQQGNGHSALRWLNVYLTEAGGDVYASEALGRKLTLVQRLQGSAQAKQVAREYLDRFPKGAYARTAEALLSK